MSKKNLIIVEGKTEKQFLSQFKKLSRYLGIIQESNVWNNTPSKNIIGNKYNNVFIFIDTDLYDGHNAISIINYIKSINSTKFYFLLQHKHFEDELCNASKLSFKELCSAFQCKSNSYSEFKRIFCQTSNLEAKLESINLNRHEMYNKQPNVYDDLVKLVTDNNLKSKVFFLTGKDWFK